MRNPQIDFERAIAALRGGQPKIAAGICDKLLMDQPRHVEARHLRGRCRAALGRWDDAVIDFRRVVGDRGDFFPAWVDLGIAEALRGNFTEARPVLERALAMDSRPAEVHFGLGLCALAASELPRAVDAFTRTLERNPQFPDGYNNLGVAYDRQGDLPRAAECFRRAVALHPADAGALRNLGGALARLGDDAGAAAALRRAAELLPADAAVQAELGDSLFKNGQPTAAAAAFERALAQQPTSTAAHLGLARLASAGGDTAAARRHAQAAAAGTDARAIPAVTLAVARELETAGAHREALEILQAAARTHPTCADVHDAAGELLHRLGRLAEALDCYERALAIDPTRVRTWIHSGNALESSGWLSRAIENFEQGLGLDPSNPQCLASIASCAYRLCDWDLADRMLAALRVSDAGIDALPAFLLLASDLEPEAIAASQRRRARATVWPPSPETPRLIAAAPRERLRVAYISPDFRTHPVAYAIAGVIERHDRGRVSPIGISLKAADTSPVGVRLQSAFDAFHDVSNRTDPEVVRLLRELKVDVAIDLAGLTTGSRPAIFAMRAAPVQVSYLGYPGSTGMPFMDCLVADARVIPVGDEPFYAERVARMPGIYLPFDDGRVIEDAAPSRQAAGLPPTGFVFCAFTSPFKITRAVFSVWMELLRDVEGSVLWLRSVGAETAGRLRSAARDGGVEPDRLVFAPSLESMTAHLSRLRLADLYLDTLPYNAHTTAAEALWAGVPVVTCEGRHFAGRVGASLLSACGMDELICRDLRHYQTLALDLARAPDRLEALRRRLVSLKPTARAFDTNRYVRDFEDLLFRLHGT